MKITTLVENYVTKEGLKGEHGLSFLVEKDEYKILFDTGQTGILIDNAKKLNIDLENVDYLILSHGHYDHTGGLESFLKVNSKAKIILHQKSIVERYSNSTGKIREIGFRLEGEIKEYKNEFIFIEEDYEINKDIKIMTNISKITDFEMEEKKLFTKKDDKYIQDEFLDEINLVINEGEKNSIITGCSHRGIINIIKTIQKRGNKEIKLILGGFHLKGKSEERIRKTISELKKINFEKIETNHCTGLDGYMELKKEFGDKVNYNYVGMIIR
ncbi:MAG: hypothetical protein B6I28_04900 [Fusobacteriia bacterium 4572_132]|nr:MAG: hypothetical protein B6I28_04900 [Fusobacteriia bacterium 4572_132]